MRHRSELRWKGGLVLAALTGFTVQPLHAQERARTQVVPYLEVGQIVSADLTDGTDVLTYSVVAVGVDAGIATRRAEAQVNLRYERRIDWGDDIGDEDVISGIARARVDAAPGLSFETGGLATRSRVDLRGDAPSNFVGGSDNVTQVYSVYAGPTVSTQVAGVSVNAAYRIGYTKVESEDVVLAPGQPSLDVFDDSVSHSASVSVGQQPGGALPVGWSVGAGYNREDASQLDQRFEEKYVRGDVTVPVTPGLALVGGVGYEDVEVSERDAVRDANGVPVVGADGRLVTDKSSPRLLAFEADGLIWDAGVLWRPSRRTSLEARVGRRYGSTTYYGNFSYQPSPRTAVGIAAYDTVSGFGSRLNDALSTLPTQFDSLRNPLTGDLNGCVFGAASSLCFNDALQSVASASFRSRGVTGYLTTTTRDGWQTGFALGYDRRRFLTADTGALAGFDGIVDESYFANLSLQKRIDQNSDFDANFYANYLDSGIGGGGNVLGVGANAAYYRDIVRGLTGTVALGVDGFDPEGLDTEVIASALLGLRYSF